MTIRVSVVVPTYRRPELLGRCLTALLAQDFDPATYEIVVADDAGSDETRRQVLAIGAEHGARVAGSVPDPTPQPPPRSREGVGGWGPEQALTLTLPEQASAPEAAESPALSAGPVVRYLPVTGRHGPAAARNVGWRAARGEIIAFTDDDTVPDAGWLRAGLAAFTEGVVGAWGRIVVPLPPAPTDYQRNEAGLEQAEFVTANCFYRRDALAAVGGFDERFRLAWREDADVFFTLLERCQADGPAGRLVRAPDALVVHPVRPASWGISLKQQRKSMFNALLYKKHPRLYRQRIQPAPPWRYYRILAALLVALGAALAGRPRPALAAAVIWTILTGRFCAERLDGASHTPRHVAEMAVTSALIPPLSIFWRLAGAVKFRVAFL